MRKLMAFACEDCGVATERMRRTGEPLVCFNCGVERALQANITSHEAAQRRRERNNARRAEINATIRRQARAKARRQKPPDPLANVVSGGGATLMEALAAHERERRRRATIAST